MPNLRFRQVHLDFHTSEHIPGIGSAFDPERFVATLKAADVDSITCFSRCHHGYIYHDTRFPFRHPHMQGNLLAEQIRACHAADIKVPIYITVGWDHLQAMLHPEWTELNAEGQRVGRKPLSDGGGWINMDFASPYVDFLEEQTQEVCDLFGDEVDGFFFDIIFQSGVHSPWCLERFQRLGWDPADLGRQAEMRELLVTELTDRLYGAVRAKNPNCSVFFNGGHVGPAFRARLRNYTHLEVESLPTGGWGYMHFPITVRYSRTLGLPCLAMTGKFSETWGHFQSYKNVAALQYECLQALAQASQCSVGDQLPPNGELDKATYDLIGAAYGLVKEREPWCTGAVAKTEIAVLNAEVFDHSAERMDPRNLGAARILIEGRHQFDFVDTEADWSAYRVLIMPDVVRLDEACIAKLQAFLDGGGSVIASHQSILGPDGRVASTFWPVVESVSGELEFTPDFMRPEADLHPQTETDFVMYERGLRLNPSGSAAVLAYVSEPYFNRTWSHFCSHAHAPVRETTGQAAVVQRGRVVVFAHPIFTTYGRHSMAFHRDVVLAALRRLLPEPLLEIDGPTSLQATLTQQGDRHIVHLLHYIPERRGLNFDIVEDPLPVLASELVARVPAQRATLVPSGEELTVTAIEGGVRVSVPAFLGHQMIALE